MYIKISISAYCLLLFVTACGNDTELSSFSSDGCSLFPDSSIITKDDWCECCFQHDLAYWQGGTAKEREFADDNLKQCVLRKTGDKTLAKVMYDGVRFGGSPYFYNWYRWGYGWSYQRKYEPLTKAEKQQAKKLMKQYFTSNKSNYCEAY